MVERPEVPAAHEQGIFPSPVFAIVAGPFGSGKTTFAKNGGLSLLGCQPDSDGNPPRYIRVGRLAHALASLQPGEPPRERDFDDAWLTAIDIVERCLDLAQPVALESSLRALPGLIRLAAGARDAGIPVHVAFLYVSDPEILVSRVRSRAGSHEPPADLVRRCHVEASVGLGVVRRWADRVLIFDANGSKPRLCCDSRPQQGSFVIVDETTWSTFPQNFRQIALGA